MDNGNERQNERALGRLPAEERAAAVMRALAAGDPLFAWKVPIDENGMRELGRRALGLSLWASWWWQKTSILTSGLWGATIAYRRGDEMAADLHMSQVEFAESHRLALAAALLTFCNTTGMDIDTAKLATGVGSLDPVFAEVQPDPEFQSLIETILFRTLSVAVDDGVASISRAAKALVEANRAHAVPACSPTESARATVAQTAPNPSRMTNPNP